MWRLPLARSTASLDAFADDEEVDVAARHHDLPGTQVAEDEDVLGELALVGLDEALADALGEQHAQLVLGVRRVPHLARGRDAERPEDQIAEPVERVDERLGDEVEGAHRRGHRQHRARRARDGEGLRGKLAQHHVQHRHDGEGEGETQPDGDAGGDRPDERLEQVLERRLGQGAEADAGDGDPELAGGEIGVDLLHGMPRRLGARLALLLELDHLAEPHPGDRELGRHEEGVQTDEEEGADDAHRGIHASPAG